MWYFFLTTWHAQGIPPHHGRSYCITIIEGFIVSQSGHTHLIFRSTNIPQWNLKEAEGITITLKYSKITNPKNKSTKS